MNSFYMWNGIIGNDHNKWVNVSAMEWEDAPANMLRRSGGLLCTTRGRRKNTLKCWICIKNVPAFFFYYIFWRFWNRWILKWQTNNSNKFSSFSVGSSKAFSLWQVGKKVMIHVFIQACVCSFCLTWFSRCLVWVKKSSFKPQIYLIECKRIFSGKINI